MHNNQLELRKLHKVLTPSWVSGFVTVAFSVLFEGAAILIGHLSSSTVQAEFFAVHQVTRGPSTSYQDIATKLSQNQIINNLPSFVFWAGVGLIVYMLAVRLVQIFNNVYSKERELGYIHVNRSKLLVETVLHLVVRIVALILLLISFEILLHHVFPQALLSAHNASHGLTLSPLRSALWSVTLMIVDLAFQTVFLRFMFLRPRLFTSSAED
jgi:hypothetical protein